MFKKNDIRSRVLAAIETSLKAAQKEYDDTCVKIDTEAERKKTALADSLVSRFTGKIL